jgi:tRNA (guanine-N7-)-methyltransferase
MARLRKAAKLWRRPESRAFAQSAMVETGDDVFLIEPKELFAADRPLEVELGAGKGDFIIDRAIHHPERNFIAVELSGVVARVLAVRCGRAGLANLKVVRMDGRTLVNLMLDAESVSAYHIYFPDPWPKERHQKHRLFTPFFVENLARTLVLDGRIHVATDVREYAEMIFRMMEAGGFIRTDETAEGCFRTGFGRKFAAAGKPIHTGVFRRPGRLEESVEKRKIR